MTAALRDRVVFSAHNLIKDPPFTNLDLVSCRNVLIYLETTLQKQVLSYLHFSLKPTRYLFLGASESVGERQDVFLPIDEKWRIYQKLGVSPGLYRWPTRSSVRAPGLGPDLKTETSLAVSSGYRSLLQEYCPPAILVDQSGELLHVLVAADRLVKIPAGAARLDLSNLLPARLGAMVTSAVHRCLRGPRPQDELGLAEESRELLVSEASADQLVGVKVRPVLDSQGNRRFALITLRDLGASTHAATFAMPDAEINEEAQHQILQLRQELQLARENFQTTVEELETANEELQATNEEVMASGQEFETTSEQLRQSLALVNEELLALTSEHHDRIGELTQLNGDMENFLNSTRQAVIFLDEHLNIRRSTPNATHYIHVLERDVGRPVEHLNRNFAGESFLEDARDVVREGLTTRRALFTLDRKESFQMSLHPYLCGPDRRGVVVTFRDTTEAPDPSWIQRMLDAMDPPVTLLGPTGIIQRTNQAWRDLSPATLSGEDLAPESQPESGSIGVYLPDLIRGWGKHCGQQPAVVSAVAAGLEEMLDRGEAAPAEGVNQDHGCAHYSRPRGAETRWYRMTMHPISHGPTELLVTHEDVTAVYPGGLEAESA